MSMVLTIIPPFNQSFGEKEEEEKERKRGRERERVCERKRER